MTQPPRVSVIMSVYDREEFYHRSIGSILAQEFTDFELIIVDDGSRQPAIDVIESFADPRIRLARLPVNSGIAMARNIGMKLARGAFIAVMDSDDFSTPDRLGKQHDFMVAHPDIDFIGSHAIKVVGENRSRLDYPADDGIIKARLLALDASSMLHPASMMRTEFLRKFDLQYPMERTDNDHALWTEAMIHGARFSSVEAPLFHHYRHAGNFTAENNSEYASHQKRKTPMRARVLGLFYPTLSHDEALAIARWMEVGRQHSIPDVCDAITAIRKAILDTKSYWGESKAEVGRLLKGHFSNAMQALTRKA